MCKMAFEMSLKYAYIFSRKNNYHTCSDKALIIEAIVLGLEQSKYLDCQLDRVDELGNKLCLLIVRRTPETPVALNSLIALKEVHHISLHAWH